MARIKGGMNARKKHNKVLKLAKGYKMCIRDSLMAGQYEENI